MPFFSAYLTIKANLPRGVIYTFLISIFTSILCGCASIGYYSQSVRGQLDLVSRKKPITELLAQTQTGDQLDLMLAMVQHIREFASKDLLLPDNGSYRDYVELDRKFVVWNVFATEEFSLQPVTSCFLIIGCLDYRGFFKQQDALDFAKKQRAADHDVFVGGVAAYSTLGWFDDPVLSSMLRYSETRLAEVIFHELAHQLIYIKNDTAFNEAFATAVGQEGVRRWLRENNRRADLRKYIRDKAWGRAFLQMILDSREKLQTLYLSTLESDQMRIRKQLILEDLQSQYQLLKSRWTDPPDYDEWMRDDLNNAKIASVLTYYDLVGAFQEILVIASNDLTTFYNHVQHLGSLNKKRRHLCLEDLTSDPICQNH